MDELKWRFPAANHGEKKGISSGDAEAFRKFPYQAFAREILQNSIDARYSDEEPTRVEFSSFEIKKEDIPGFADLEAQVRRCREYFNYKSDYVEVYDKILSAFHKENIKCLRVSDYNTTGLVGVDSSSLEGNKFNALAKGTGLSEKNSSVSGGSKGVGKNAAFLMSKIKTVFYSTNANQNTDGTPSSHLGYMGVSNLISGWIDDQHKEPGDDYTQGTGYFSADDSNDAIHGILDLDPSCHKRKDESGTDIYILGFEPESDWRNEIICSILDSFMAAINRNQLSVAVDGQEINSETLGSLVYDSKIVSEKMRSGIISQYLLLTGAEGKVKTYDIDTGYGTCELFVLPLKKDEVALATHRCVMIRHPLMKIKEIAMGSTFPVSAMCIIGEGTIGEMLRRIENPQHVDWEANRIEDPAERKEYRNLLNDITQQIKDFVIECLKVDDEQEIDPNGAGDFLPEANEGESSSDGNGYDKPQETVTVTKPKENITVEKNANTNQDDGSGLEPDIGEKEDGDADEVSFPDGENEGDGGDARPGSNSGDETEGDNVIFKRKKLAGVRYRVISTDKKNGKLRIVFTAPIDNKGCYLSVSMLDDNNNSSPIEITGLSKNGVSVECSDSNEYGPFEIMSNEKVVLDVTTNTNDYFGSEVKVICK